MRQTEQNKLSMMRVVYKTLNDHQTIFKDNKALGQAFLDLNTVIVAMETALAAQQRRTEGVTEDKEDAEDHAITLVLELAGAARAYALDHEDHDLYTKLDYSRNSLDRMPENQRLATLINMVTAIQLIAPQLTDAGVDSNEIMETSSAVTTFRDLMIAPRDVIDTRKTATDSLPELRKQARKLLEKSDSLMIRYRRTYPAFVNQYENARIVIYTGVRHKPKDDKKDGDTEKKE